MNKEIIQQFLIDNSDKVFQLFGKCGFGVKDFYLDANKKNRGFKLSIYLEEEKPKILPAIIIVTIEEIEYELSVEICSENCGIAKIN